jgi:hypothetical protein
MIIRIISCDYKIISNITINYFSISVRPTGLCGELQQELLQLREESSQARRAGEKD